MHELHLQVPSFDELWYRKQLMEDPATMDYNRGYDLPFQGYNPETGCMAFPESEWRSWYGYFIGNEPERFYAYIAQDDGTFLGEVNVHRSDAQPWYEMGIVIEAKYRGQGYSLPALRLLLKYAFEVLRAPAVHNDFEETRAAALRLHLAAGFTFYRQENGIVELLITREQFEAAKKGEV